MVKNNRSLANYILLSIATCGIYSLIFISDLVKDINIICAGDGEETKGVGQFFFLSIVTCGIYGFIWWHKLGDRLANNAERYGLRFNENGTTVLMWMIFFVPVGMNIVIKNTNALATAYLSKK